METINITIPDNLTPTQEALEIAKQISKKALQAPCKKAIGDVISIKHLHTQINVNRESVEKPIKTIECSVCGTIYEESIGVSLYTNYGGLVKKKLFCSEDCRDVVIGIFGDRCSIKKIGLRPALLF